MDGDTRVHCIPVNDVVLYDTASDDCLCGPRIELVRHENGPDGWVIVHHSLDGRERFEQRGEATT